MISATVRVALFGALWLVWPMLVDRLFQGSTEVVRTYWREVRSKLLLGALIIELVLIQLPLLRTL